MHQPAGGAGRVHGAQDLELGAVFHEPGGVARREGKVGDHRVARILGVERAARDAADDAVGAGAEIAPGGEGLRGRDFDGQDAGVRGGAGQQHGRDQGGSDQGHGHSSARVLARCAKATTDGGGRKAFPLAHPRGFPCGAGWGIAG